MRALTTTAVLPAQQPKPKAKRIRFRLWPKKQPATLFQRCLAVHIAKTSALK